MIADEVEVFGNAAIDTAADVDADGVVVSAGHGLHT